MKRANSIKMLFLVIVSLVFFSNFFTIGYSSDVGIPNGLEVNHNYSLSQLSGVFPMKLTFTRPSSDTIHIVNYLGGSIDDTGSWDVNTNTRIISNVVNFGPFEDDHSVFWIYTDVALNDQLLMCNIWKAVHTGVGDATFNITGEAIHGSMEVWVLEDDFGSELWYEKERGFMVNGTIKHNADYNNYDFVSFSVPQPGVPGYSLFLLISVIAIISIVIIKKQTIKK